MWKDMFSLNGRWGRLNRMRYFGYSLLSGIVFYAIGFVIGYGTTSLGLDVETMIIVTAALNFVVMIPAIWISICVGAKRCHDLDKTAWLLLAFLVPIVNLIVGLYLLFAPGTAGDNQYGPDPLQQS